MQARAFFDSILSMRKSLVFIVCLTLFCTKCYAENDVQQLLSDAEQTYRIAQEICVGISDEISEIRTLAGVNTGVTGVGTIAGGASVVVGLEKVDVDAEIEELEKYICDSGGCDPENIESMSEADFFENIIWPLVEINRLTELKEKSKKLGNWRTGLLAGAAATHVASAIMSGINAEQSDLIQRISACNNALDKLKNIAAQMKESGANPMEFPIIRKINLAADMCDRINIEDVKKIEVRENWVLGTSVVGGVAALSGVATSAAANSDDISDKEKQKKLNSASNVLGGISTVGSATATAFNISLLTLTKNMIKQALRCEQEFMND